MKHVAYTGVALAALAGMVGCATGPPKTDAQRQADKQVAERVEAALEADRALYAKHIFVHANNGIVRLSGYVWDPADLDEAKSVAARVPGVTRVVDNLELENAGMGNSPAAR